MPSKNTRNRKISFRGIAAVVHFFIRAVFLAELENFEIIKSKKNVTEWQISLIYGIFKLELIIYTGLVLQTV